jgi:hypothetical protein
LNLFNPLNTPQPQQPTQSFAPLNQQQAKPKMKAPEFDFEDISAKKIN